MRVLWKEAYDTGLKKRRWVLSSRLFDFPIVGGGTCVLVYAATGTLGSDSWSDAEDDASAGSFGFEDGSAGC